MSRCRTQREDNCVQSLIPLEPVFDFCPFTAKILRLLRWESGVEGQAPLKGDRTATRVLMEPREGCGRPSGARASEALFGYPVLDGVQADLRHAQRLDFRRETSCRNRSEQSPPHSGSIRNMYTPQRSRNHGGTIMGPRMTRTDPRIARIHADHKEAFQ